MTSQEIELRAQNHARKTLLDWYEQQLEGKEREVMSLFQRLHNEKTQPYLLSHESFEDYCADRWNMTARRVKQILDSGTTKVQLLADAPEMALRIEAMGERPLRELVPLAPEKRVEVIREAISSPGKLSTSKIKQAKARVVGAPSAPKVIDAEFTEPARCKCAACGGTGWITLPAPKQLADKEEA